MSNIPLDTFSPGSVTSPINLNDDNDLIHLINSLSSSIKGYYNRTKDSLIEAKQMATSSSSSIKESNIETIDSNLKSFMLEAKDIFQKLKQVRNKQKETFQGPFYKIPIVTQRQRNGSRNQPYSPQTKAGTKIGIKYEKKLATMLSPIYNEPNNSLIDPPQNIVLQSNSEKVLLLANGVINFLTLIFQMEDSLLKKKNDINDKKKKFEKIKGELMTLAQSILDSHNSCAWSKRDVYGKSLCAIKKLDLSTIKAININKTMSGSYPSFVDKIKNKIISLQKENGELHLLHQKSSDFKEYYSSRNQLRNRLKDTETEVKRLRKINSRSKASPSPEDREYGKSNNKIKELNSTVRDYKILLEDKENIINVLQNNIRQLVLDKETICYNNNTDDENEKQKEASFIKENIVFRIDLHDPEIPIDNDPLLEPIDQYNKIINVFNEEIKAKKEAIKQLEEDNKMKLRQIKLEHSNEILELKDLIEKNITAFNQKLKVKADDNKKLKNELNIANEQLQNLTLIKNSKDDNERLIEMQKLQNQLSKEINEKNNSYAQVTLLNKDIMNMKNEVSLNNVHIAKLNEQLINAKSLENNHENTIDSLKDNIVRLNEQLINAKSIENSQKSTIDSLKDNIEKINEQLINAKNIENSQKTIINSLKNDITKITNESKLYQQDTQQLTKQLSKINEDFKINDQTALIISLKEEITKLNNESTAHLQELIEMTHKHQIQEKEIIKLNEIIEKHNHDSHELSNFNEMMESFKQEMTKITNESQSRQNDNEKLIKTLKEDISILTIETKEKQFEIERLREAIITSTHKNTQEHNENEILIKSMKQEITKLTLELKGQKKDNRKLQDEIKQGHDDIINEKINSARLKEDSSNIITTEEIIIKTEQIGELSSRNKTANEELHKCQTELEELRQEYTMFKEKSVPKEKVDEQIKEQNNTINQQQTQIQNLLQLQEELKRCSNKKSDDITALSLQIYQLNESGDLIRGMISRKDKELQDIRKANSRYNELKLQAESELVRLKDYYEYRLREISQSIESNQIASNTQEQLQNKIIALQEEYRKKCSQIEIKNSQMDHISTQNMKHQQEITSLKEFIRQKEEDIKFMKKAYNSSTINTAQQSLIISSNTHMIICDKSFKKLHWYLLTLKAKNEDDINNSYKNTYWVDSEMIGDVGKYNKFTTEKELEDQLYNQVTKVQTKLIRQLEEKEDEIQQLQSIKKQFKTQLSNNNNHALSRNHQDKLSLNSPPNSLTNDPNSMNIPIEQYEKVVNQLNEINHSYSKSQEMIIKLNNEKKELSKLADGVGPEIEYNLSGIDKDLKTNHSPFVEEDINDYMIKPNDFEDKLVELKKLIQLLIYTVIFSSEIKKILLSICLLIGFSEEEFNKMISDKEKAIKPSRSKKK